MHVNTVLIDNELHDWPVHPDLVPLSHVDELDAISEDGELHVVSPGVGPDGRVKLSLALSGVEVSEGDVIQINLSGQQREGFRFTINLFHTFLINILII